MKWFLFFFGVYYFIQCLALNFQQCQKYFTYMECSLVSSNEWTNRTENYEDVTFLRLQCEIKLQIKDAKILGQKISTWLPKLSNLTIYNCGPNILWTVPHLEQKFVLLNLSGNSITEAPWAIFSKIYVWMLDLRNNEINNCHCKNYWLYEVQQQKMNNNNIHISYDFDIHTIFPQLPTKILLDISPSISNCQLNLCNTESVEIMIETILEIGKPLHLTSNTFFSLNTEINKSPWKNWIIWVLDDNEKPVLRTYSLENFNNRSLNLYLKSTSSNELGLIACKCLFCLRPIFALKFIVNPTAHIDSNTETNESTLIIHGYPIDSMELELVRLWDNASEILKLSSTLTSFFNDSIQIKFISDHSYFFVKYYSIYLHECLTNCLTVGEILEGTYFIKLCSLKSEICINLTHYFTYSKHFYKEKIIPTIISSNQNKSNIIILAIFLLLCIGFTVIYGIFSPWGLFECQFRQNSLLGWKLKKRNSHRHQRQQLTNISRRNTEQTEDTHIPLEEFSYYGDSIMEDKSSIYTTKYVSLIPSADIKLMERIGKGAFGEVFYGQWITKNLKIAIKMLEKMEMNSEIDKEAALLAKLDHQNVLRFFGVCMVGGKISLVLEFMNLGDLKTYLRNREPRCGNYSQFPPALISTELFRLCYLNTQQIIHRDIACRNILVSGETDLKICEAAFRPPFCVKISDFGMSRKLYSDSNYYQMNKENSSLLPIRWLAPECLKSGKFTHKSDMWSYGMTLYEIYTFGGIPYENLTNWEVLNGILGGLRPEIPKTCPHVISTIIKNCWDECPEQRLDAEKTYENLNRVTL